MLQYNWVYTKVLVSLKKGGARRKRIPHTHTQRKKKERKQKECSQFHHDIVVFVVQPLEQNR